MILFYQCLEKLLNWKCIPVKNYILERVCIFVPKWTTNSFNILFEVISVYIVGSKNYFKPLIIILHYEIGLGLKGLPKLALLHLSIGSILLFSV